VDSFKGAGSAPRNVDQPAKEEHKDQTQPLPLTVGRELYEKHIARSRVTGGVKPSTQKRYRTVFDKFIVFAGANGITDWHDVSAEVLEDYAGYLEHENKAYKTICNELVTMKQTVRWLIEAGHLIGTEPIKLALRKAESERPYCYTAEEAKAMIDHCTSTSKLAWLGNVIVSLVYTGLRISELASLKWSDVNLEAKNITLTDETGHSSPTTSRRTTKSGRSRSFPIHDNLLIVLNAMPRSAGMIFRGPRGGRLKPDTVRNCLVRDVISPLSDQFASAPDEKGFKDGRLHSFRHFFCSTCANSGVPELMVMAWLGHSDSEMVRHYYHLNDTEAKRRMNNIDFLGDGLGRSEDVA